MTRFPFESTLTDQFGRIIVGGTVTVNLTGTSTAATIYAAESGGSAITDSQITTGSDGTYKFWVDTLDFVATQRFRLVLDGGSPFGPRTIDDIVIILSIEVTAGSTTTFMNKTIDADDNTLSNLEIGAEVKPTVVASDLNLAGLNLDDVGVIFLKEQAAADSNVAGSGQIWVKTAAPNILQFSDDVGTDFVLVHRSDKLDVFAATTSAELAGVISDETGSGGGFVRATSPTLATPILGAAAATDVTITGSAAATPDANTLTKDHMVGARCTFNGTGTPAYIEEINFSGAITDNGTGNYTLTIDRDFANANYAANVNGGGGNAPFITTTNNEAVGSLDIIGEDNAGSAIDKPRISVVLIGAQ